MKSTLLITTFNRGHLLQHSLDRLCHLTIPDDVLVVDDGSWDDTEKIVKSFVNKLPIRYIYNHSPRVTICSMARNIGINNTDNEIIITAEPELLFVTDVIKQELEGHDLHPDCVISAGTIYHEQPNAKFNPGYISDPAGALRDEIVELYQIEPRSYRMDGLCKVVGWVAPFTGLYEKKWLVDIGGWDEDFPGSWGYDDNDLLSRLRINGINQIIDNSIECIHQRHIKLPVDKQSEANGLNENYLLSKQLDECSKGDERLIANRGKLWGQIIPRP